VNISLWWREPESGGDPGTEERGDRFVSISVLLGKDPSRKITRRYEVRQKRFPDFRQQHRPLALHHRTGSESVLVDLLCRFFATMNVTPAQIGRSLAACAEIVDRADPVARPSASARRKHRRPLHSNFRTRISPRTGDPQLKDRVQGARYPRELQKMGGRLSEVQQ